ncbi:MAG: hypothetical protein ACTHL8_11020 [Burkholderiaceae bacterium]
MRLVARFVVLLVAVCGVSVAFAWAWDRSDASHGAAATPDQAAQAGHAAS